MHKCKVAILFVSIGNRLERALWRPLSFIYLEKARQPFFSQTVEAKKHGGFLTNNDAI